MIKLYNMIKLHKMNAQAFFTFYKIYIKYPLSQCASQDFIR